MSGSNVTVPTAELTSFCRSHHIERLSLFGSVLGQNFRPDSDVDVLVEFAPGYVPGLIGLGTMELELSRLFGGRKVDLHTPASISAEFRQQVLDSAEVQVELKDA